MYNNTQLFISGGWLLVSNITMESSTPPSQLPIKTSYRGITSDQMVLTKTAMNELRTHLSFTQLRFHCSKNNGRTFHVTTVANSTGEAVVQYFSGQTDVQPASCGSYVRRENDNSKLARVCKIWGRNGKWRSGESQERLYKSLAFSLGCFWNTKPPYFLRDDVNSSPTSSGDFWKVNFR